MTDQNLSRTKRSSQAIDNFSFDEDFLGKVVELVKRNQAGTAIEYFNPATEETLAGTMSIAVDETSTVGVIYVGKAAIGSSISSPVWQVKKIYEDSTPSQWADGNSNFDNVWDNRPSLTYS